MSHWFLQESSIWQKTVVLSAAETISSLTIFFSGCSVWPYSKFYWQILLKLVKEFSCLVALCSENMAKEPWPATNHIGRASDCPTCDTAVLREHVFLKYSKTLDSVAMWDLGLPVSRSVLFALSVQEAITWAKAALGVQSTEHTVGQLWSTQEELVRQISVNWTIQCSVTFLLGIFFIFWVSHCGLFWFQLHCLICLLVRMFVFPEEKQ